MNAIVWLAFSLLSTGFAQAAAGDLQATAACTPSESWTWSPRIPMAWQKQFSRIELGREGAIRTYAWANVLRTTGKAEEARALAEYFQARALHTIGMPTLAFRSWNEILVRDFGESKAADGIKRATWACLARLREKNPALGVTPAMMQFATTRGLEGVDPALVAVSTFDYIRRKLAETSPETTLDLEPELTLLKNHVAFEQAARALIAARDSKDEEVIKAAAVAIASPSGDKAALSLSQDVRDQLRMLSARSHYHLKRWKEAILSYESVRAPSNWFAQAIVEKAWAQLNAGQYQASSSSAHNLMVGKLRAVFSPEPSTIIAIALFENCRYPEALKTVRLFKRFYQPSYAWLFQWRKSASAGEGLYGKALGYLKKTEKVPDPIATEWIRSPVFLAYQQALNGLIDEKRVAREVTAYLVRTQASIKDKSMARARATLKQQLDRYPAQLAQVEKATIQKIESDLAARNMQMLKLIAETAENAQLVEAEIFNAAGEDMILTNIEKNGGKTRRPASRKGVVAAEKQGATLDWGKLPKGSLESDGDLELWEDELGALWANLDSRCR